MTERTAHVTVHHGAEAPATQAATGSAGIADVVLTDPAGRRLTLRDPDIIQESRLVRMMGEAAMNAAYMTGYVLPAAMVCAIDGEELLFPVTPPQVEAAIKMVGRNGLATVMRHLQERAEREQEQARDSIKK